MNSDVTRAIFVSYLFHPPPTPPDPLRISPCHAHSQVSFSSSSHPPPHISSRRRHIRPMKMIPIFITPSPLTRVTQIPPRHLPCQDHLFAERDAARRFHALSELLSTELGYLFDLRILVSVYLRLLPVLKNRSTLPLSHGSSSNPTISYFTRPSSIHLPHSVSFRPQSHPHLNGATLTYPAESHPAGSSLSYPVPAGVEKCTTRHLFSASDLDTITRNAEDILEFHERLVHQLRQVISPFRISMTTREFLAENSVQSHLNSSIDIYRVINAVSAVFVDHASSFDQYQSFCSGHSEAFDLVRKVQHRYPAEWDAFELRCAAVASEMLSPDVAEELIQSSESIIHVFDPCKRRHSFSSLDAASSESLRVPMLSTSESGHTDKDTSNRKPRLMFMDYMIKPVQRVCKYPLLFDQLQERTAQQRFSSDSISIPRDGQDAVKSALWAMRNAASLVDDARRQQELFAKSAQIVSRITQGLLTSVASHNRPPQAVSLSTFLSTLGACHLSGSLDVIHYRGTNMARLGTVRAKYLGAFLFPGGFLVLAKVAKSKAYEPKYWFNLRGFELVDSNLDDVLLPSWFRLSSKAHMFEFAASCRREKDIWVDAIRRAVAEEVPWTDEPPLSHQTEYIASLPEDTTVESAVPNSENPALPQIFPPAENAAKHDITVPPVPSRRSSVVIQSVPMPESNTFHLVRPTASAKEQVDRGLLDIFSEKCLTARFHAHTHEEDLFEAQRVTRSFTRSTSALTMASAMSVAAKNRLTKRESVLVPRKRSFLEGNSILGDTEVISSHTVVPKPVKMRQPPNKLKIVAITKPSSQQGDEDGNELCLDSPSPMSHCSSVSFVTPPTPLTTAVALSTPSCKAESVQSHSEFLNVYRKDYVPKRSKSMIDNVRGFFISRSASPTPALSRELSTESSRVTWSSLRQYPSDVQDLVLSLGDPWLGQDDNNILPSATETTITPHAGDLQRKRSVTDLAALSEVINELVNTERSYVKRLRTLKNDYADPLRQFSKSKSTAILPPYEAKTLFGNIDVLLPVNEVFLTDLEKVVAPNGSQNIGDVALRHFKDLRGFEHYKQYYVKREEAQSIFEREMMKKSSGFAAYIDRIKYSSADTRNRVGLRELLMDPVQRIPRYTLLFRTMVKLMGPDDPQRAKLIEADEFASKIAQAETDDHTRRAAVMYCLSATIDNFPAGLISNSRRFIDCIDVEDIIMDGPPGVSSSASSIAAISLHCTLFLFDDKLMIVKRPGNGEKSGRLLSGLDEVEKLAKTGGLPLGMKRSGMSCKEVLDLCDVVVADVGEAVLCSDEREVEVRGGRTTLARTYFNVYQRTAFLQETKKTKVVMHIDPLGSADPLPFGMGGPPYVIVRVHPMAGEISRYSVSSSDPNDDPEEEIVQTSRIPGRIVQTSE
ncbi:hypothetical protein JVU11DRAFT_1666, partial [Chiua virens]